MRRSAIETMLGAVVLLVAVVFLFLAYNSIDLKPTGGYQVSAKFYAIDGLTVGSDVRIGGVKIGAVVKQYVDPEEFQAVVRLSIQDGIRIPTDSVATISSDGLLGGKYIKIEPGQSDDLVSAEGEIQETRDVIALEELLGKVIFLVTNEEVE